MTREEKIKEAEEFVKQDNYQEAINKYCTIWKDSPFDSEVIKRILFLYSRIHEGNLDFQPSTSETFMFRGISRFWEENLEDSIKDLDRAINLNPKNDYAYKSRAFSKFYSNKPEEAFADIKHAISMNPIGDYIDNLAQFYSETGDSANALKYYQKAVETEPNNPRLWYNYGIELRDNGEYERAYEMYNKAIALWPQYPDAIANIKYLLDSGLVKRYRN